MIQGKRGTTVAETPRALSPDERRRSLESQAATFVAQARLLGVTDEVIAEAVQRALSPTPGGREVSA